MSLSKLRKVPSFIRPDECSQASVTEEVKRKQRVSRIWEMDLTFDTKDAASEFLDMENTWRIETTNNSKEGEKVVYCCSKTRQREKSSCPAMLQLLYHCDSSKVSVFRFCEHNDHDGGAQKIGIPQPTKQIIQGLFQDGVQRPNAIIEALRKRQVTEPLKGQLTSYLSYLRKKKYGPATANIKVLLDWCDSHSVIPNSEDEAFVLDKHITTASDSVEHLRICLSTKRLLTLVQHAEVLHADGTYKLNWNGCPVLIVGTSDKNCVFHPIAISICYQEETEDYEFIFRAVKDQAHKIHKIRLNPHALMADGSSAITSGFEKTLGKDYVRLMCYFHLTKSVDTHIRSFNAEIRSELKSDIGLLQLACSDEEFNIGAELFLNKWNSNSLDSKMEDFLDYFQRQWLTTQRFWYEGAYSGGPSTNNGLEATNAVIKRDHTFRERLPVQQFLSLLVGKLLPSWSIERNPTSVNFKPFATEPLIKLDVWTKAYQWAASGVTLLSEELCPGTHTYYAASSETQKSSGQINEDLVNQYKITPASFVEYSKRRTSLWVINITGDEWKQAKCSCPIFLKRYICKHSVGLGIRLGLTDVPVAAKNIQVGQKRKRGRPSKAKLALVVK